MSTAFYQRLGFRLSSASVPGIVSFFRTAGGQPGRGSAADAQLQRTEPGFAGISLAINVGPETRWTLRWPARRARRRCIGAPMPTGGLPTTSPADGFAQVAPADVPSDAVAAFPG